MLIRPEDRKPIPKEEWRVQPEQKFVKWTVVGKPFSYKSPGGSPRQYVDVKCACSSFCCEQTVLVDNLTRGYSTQCVSCAKFTGIGLISRNFFNKAKFSAARRGIEFDLIIEDLYNQFVSQNGKDPYTNDELFDRAAPSNASKKKISNMSLDRIDSSRGYIKGNIEITTKQTNMKKQQDSKDEHIQYCRKVAKNFEGVKTENLDINQQPQPVATAE